MSLLRNIASDMRTGIHFAKKCSNHQATLTRAALLRECRYDTTDRVLAELLCANGWLVRAFAIKPSALDLERSDPTKITDPTTLISIDEQGSELSPFKPTVHDLAQGLYFQPGLV